MYEPSIRKQEHRWSSDFPLCILLAIIFALNDTLFFSASYVSIISFNTSEPVYFVLMGHKYETSKNSEAVARRCSIKKLFLDILQNSQENSLQLYEKSGSGTDVFMWILQNLKGHLFCRTPPVVASKHLQDWYGHVSLPGHLCFRSCYLQRLQPCDPCTKQFELLDNAVYLSLDEIF